jgi:Leucine-rich repeat (LRR) protein
LTLDLSFKHLTSLNGIKLDVNLHNINLHDNKLKEIGGLSALTNLQELYLSFNEIKEIGGLSSLTNLQVLSLGNNQIKEIGGLSSLTNLQHLFLNGNEIPDWREKRDSLLQRNIAIKWDVVKPKFIRYCFTLAPLNLPVDILIMIYDVNSYPNHLYKKWEIAKTIKDAYQKYKRIE